MGSPPTNPHLKDSPRAVGLPAPTTSLFLRVSPTPSKPRGLRASHSRTDTALGSATTPRRARPSAPVPARAARHPPQPTPPAAVRRPAFSRAFYTRPARLAPASRGPRLSRHRRVRQHGGRGCRGSAGPRPVSAGPRPTRPSITPGTCPATPSPPLRAQSLHNAPPPPRYVPGPSVLPPRYMPGPALPPATCPAPASPPVRVRTLHNPPSACPDPP